jgi:pimeloyl-ACP methyl ester carboxylesterase
MTGLALLAFTAVLVMFYDDGETALQRTLPGTTVAVALFSGTAAGLVGLAVLAYRNRQTRRTVGIIWDVVTFWPRANHPLTPPCYAERAVPELRLQLCQHMAAADEQRVIAATHSQGTIIGAATVLQLSDAVRRRIALLTFGSPLRRLYGRNFPAYFGLTAMTRLHSVQPHWINMWVFSDPIGGWILNDTNANLADALRLVDYRIPDAETLDPGPRDQTLPICAHSGYADRPEYRKVIAALDKQLVPQPPPDHED